MPLQNRVTPFGDIVATPEYGMFTGNRGIIHDPATRTLLARRWTELFFLDEATALSAGHRPCFTCRRTAAEAFRAAWAKGNGVELPGAPAMDAALHRERLYGRRKRLHRLAETARRLPDGTMVAAGERALLVVGGRLRRWTTAGYLALESLPEVDGVLTPPSTLAALAAGYAPVLHESAMP